jgi:16S rRNA processing protein RimM
MKNVAIVRFRGVNDRNAAESLNGLDLYIERANLPDDDLDEDEFFYADLEGLEALDSTGTSHGIVTGIFDFGAGDLLELKSPSKRPVLIPFIEAAVLEIDLEAGTILIDPVAAGLVDADEDGPGSQKRKPPAGPGAE